MSYWYARITKKHVLCLLMIIPLLLANNAAQLCGSYAAGCLATASRTVYDWISVERAGNAFEVYPFVQMNFDMGCIEWLGFSTCEAAQFEDWMPIWMQSEIITVNIFNTTTIDAIDQSIFQTAELVPLSIQQMNFDDSTSASPGSINLKRKVTFAYDFDATRLAETIVTGVSVAAGNPWKAVKLGELLGLSNSGMVYLDTKERYESSTFTSPSPVNKMLRDRVLYYFLSENVDHRCQFDDDCGQQCTWSSACEPLSYGHQGTLLPSASMLMDWKPAFELGHWPIPAWAYRDYCPTSDYDVSCHQAVSKEVIIFNPDALSRSTFGNTGNTANEKFPDLEFQLWKATGYARREEGCKTPMIFGSQGKDCGVPAEYVWVGSGLFASSPTGKGAALVSEIHSERVSGLRFDYLHVWQINRRLTLVKPNNAKVDTFLALFWTQRQPVKLVLHEKLQFSALKDYGSSMMSMMAIGWAIYTITYFMFLALFFYGAGCVDWCKAVDINNAPNVHVWL